LKNLAYSHFRRTPVENDIGLTWCSASRNLD
jgi:hypothetical protein